MYVVGTAGHVDHGKSTLISALTGINPDRLKEEKERQMTIDLGFAWYTLPSGEEIGIVDVPGHRDFIENMLAGVGGIDAVLFVIAADEGIMPQSREHLDIIKLLGIKLGLVVLTKIDLIKDQDWIDLVESDIHDLVNHSFLSNAPIIKVSAVNGTGLDELSQELDLILKKSTPKETSDNPRLPIDRIFSLKGFGTIVTGTLIDGCLREGDQVEIMPAGIKSRIRSIQNHKKKQPVAEPGNRTAVNLVGVDVDELKRGDVICLPGKMTPTKRIDVKVNLLNNKAANIGHDDQLKVFIGASQSLARARVIEKKEIKPGETGWLQLEFEKPIMAKNEDRFIIRRPSPATTIGGGIVLAAFPKKRHRRFSQNVADRFQTLLTGSTADSIMLHLSDLKIAMVSKLIELGEIDSDLALTTIKDLLQEGKIINLESNTRLELTSRITSMRFWTDTKKTIINNLERFHKKYPLQAGTSYEDISKNIGLSKNAAVVIIEKMLINGDIQVEDGKLFLPTHHVVFTSEQTNLINKLEKVFSESPYLSPSVQDCIDVVGNNVYQAMVTKGLIVEVSPGVVFMRDDLDHIISETTLHLKEGEKLSAGEFRDRIGTSRKYAIALLEYMDKVGITKRIDDYRVLKES